MEKRLAIILTIIACTIVIIAWTNTYEKKNKCEDCNIILIVIDALRQDHVGTYGYYRNTTPNIDKLAEKSIVFQNAISQATWTKPSIASLFTSTYPTRHQTYAIQGINNRGKIALPDSFNTLAEQLKEKGYATVGLSHNIYTHPEFNLIQGFDEFEVIAPDQKITTEAIEVIKNLKNGKTFFYIHYLGPHAPYYPPYPYNESFMENTYEYVNTSNPKVHEIKKKIKSEEQLDYVISQYDGDIAFIDNEIGQLLETLEKNMLEENTIIIITSDHGEDFLEHDGFIGHSNLPYETQIKVPLIMRIPDTKEKELIIDPVQLVDIMPTVLYSTGIEVPLGLDGVNLFSVKKDDIIRSKVFSEQINPRKHSISVRTEDWKYIYNIITKKEMLFNLKEDPYEMHRLSGNLKIKQGFNVDVMEYYKNNLKKAEETKNIKDEKLSEENFKKLRELGYL